MFKKTEKACKASLNALVTPLFPEGSQFTWELLWHSRFGQGTPRWYHFNEGNKYIAAVSPVQVNGHSYWVVVRPAEPMTWTGLLTLGVLSAMFGADTRVALWKADPRNPVPSWADPDTSQVERVRIKSREDVRRVTGG